MGHSSYFTPSVMVTTFGTQGGILETSALVVDVRTIVTTTAFGGFVIQCSCNMCQPEVRSNLRKQAKRRQC